LLVVPEKTIAYIPVIPKETILPFNMDISSFLKPLNENHKRDWFTPHFYRCLPLSIANMQGLAFSSPFSFDVLWNGENKTESISFNVYNDSEIQNIEKMNHVSISSEFGYGIFTMHFPLMLKTPPNVNLMTIAPPNYPLPGISPMSGVVETDNLSFTFTLNFKIDLPNTLIKIQKNYPLMGIIPIPRYYCDSFKLVNAYDILNKDDIEEQRQIAQEQNLSRKKQINERSKKADGRYYRGTDIRNNKFKNHQLPKGNT
jgi:hypothetical protein